MSTNELKKYAEDALEQVPEKHRRVDGVSEGDLRQRVHPRDHPRRRTPSGGRCATGTRAAQPASTCREA